MAFLGQRAGARAAEDVSWKNSMGSEYEKAEGQPRRLDSLLYTGIGNASSSEDCQLYLPGMQGRQKTCQKGPPKEKTTAWEPVTQPC